jgi:hypothetical protein
MTEGDVFIAIPTTVMCSNGFVNKTDGRFRLHRRGTGSEA